jgi:hypothetical protein
MHGRHRQMRQEKAKWEKAKKQDKIKQDSHKTREENHKGKTKQPGQNKTRKEDKTINTRQSKIKTET